MIVSNYYKTDDYVKSKVRKNFQVNDFSIKRDVQIVKDWIKQQRHLPQNQDDDFIENCLLHNKFRVERTKQRLDMYFSLKNLHSNSIDKIPFPVPSTITSCLSFPLPQLTNNFERILILKTKSGVVDDDSVCQLLKYIWCCADYTLRCDYCLGFRIIQDLEGLTLEQAKSFSTKLNTITSALKILLGRIAGVECLNFPGFVEASIKACQQFMNQKAFQKITVHKDLDSLHKNIDKAYLPKEYGGDLGPMHEFVEKWEEELKNNSDALEHILKTERSDESLRIGELKMNEIFGVDGTFKNLSFD